LLRFKLPGVEWHCLFPASRQTRTAADESLQYYVSSSVRKLRATGVLLVVAMPFHALYSMRVVMATFTSGGECFSVRTQDVTLYRHAHNTLSQAVGNPSTVAMNFNMWAQHYENRISIRDKKDQQARPTTSLWVVLA
jgi:hypothetical protein